MGKTILSWLVRVLDADKLVGYGPDKVAFPATVTARGMKGNSDEQLIQSILWLKYKYCAKPWQEKGGEYITR